MDIVKCNGANGETMHHHLKTNQCPYGGGKFFEVLEITILIFDYLTGMNTKHHILPIDFKLTFSLLTQTSKKNGGTLKSLHSLKPRIHICTSEKMLWLQGNHELSPATE